MKVVIIDDEQPAYDVLSKQLRAIIPGIEIEPPLNSVEEACSWFARNEWPDVVFLDIHLADGSAFDLLKVVKIECPIIFTTAYDQYAIEAFKTASIDYLLKPLKKEELQAALLKLKTLKSFFTKSANTSTALPVQVEYKSRFVVRFGEHIKTLQVDEIAYFFSENKNVYAKTTDGKSFPMDQNLDTLEEQLDPKVFFRINRQYLVHLRAIEDMRIYSKARILVTLKPAVKDVQVVSSERSPYFKQWLDGKI